MGGTSEFGWELRSHLDGYRNGGEVYDQYCLRST